jgi:hypothetical protein
MLLAYLFISSRIVIVVIIGRIGFPVSRFSLLTHVFEANLNTSAVGYETILFGWTVYKSLTSKLEHNSEKIDLKTLLIRDNILYFSGYVLLCEYAI